MSGQAYFYSVLASIVEGYILYCGTFYMWLQLNITKIMAF